MSSLQALNNRIKGIKSTQKVTKAMQLISASRLNRARENLKNSIPYADAFKNLTSHISTSGSSHPMITGNENGKFSLVIVITSDRGLCGAFNNQITTKAKKYCNKLDEEKKQFKLICVGKRGYKSLKSIKDANDIKFINQMKNVSISSAEEIASEIFQMCDAKDLKECTLIYSKFISVIKNEVVKQKLIPYEASDSKNSNYSFEPKLEIIQDEVICKNLVTQVYRALLENATSEHSARMTAMDNATRNSKDILHNLSHQYNRTRQALITKELIEIISGAEALK